MAFDHDEFIRILTDYYQFCSHRFWKQPIHQAPPGGWPSVTDEIIEKLGKNETAAKLIRHLPYPEYSMESDHFVFTPRIMNETLLVDYRAEGIQEWILRSGESGYMIDPEVTPSDCVVIAMSYGLSGYYVVVDTTEGYVYWGDINGCHDEPEPELSEVIETHPETEENEWRLTTNVYRPADLFTLCKQRFLEMRWVGFGPDQIMSLRMNEKWGSDNEHNAMVTALKRAGWPGDEEARGYDLQLMIRIFNELEGGDNGVVS